MTRCPVPGRPSVAGFSRFLFLFAKNLIYNLCFLHLASPQRTALYPPLQVQRLGSLFLFSLDFRTDDGAAWTQGVKYPSWISASNSVCLTSIRAGSTSLCGRRAAVRKGRLWLQQLLMPPFTPQPAGLGSCSRFGGTTLSPSPWVRRCKPRAVWHAAAGTRTAATVEMEAALRCFPWRFTLFSMAGRRRGELGGVLELKSPNLVCSSACIISSWLLPHWPLLQPAFSLFIFSPRSPNAALEPLCTAQIHRACTRTHTHNPKGLPRPPQVGKDVHVQHRQCQRTYSLCLLCSPHANLLGLHRLFSHS